VRFLIEADPPLISLTVGQKRSALNLPYKREAFVLERLYTCLLKVRERLNCPILPAPPPASRQHANSTCPYPPGTHLKIKIGIKVSRRFPLKLKSIESRLPEIDKIYEMAIFQIKASLPPQKNSALSIWISHVCLLSTGQAVKLCNDGCKGCVGWFVR